ncbi:HNH endonuclease [Acidovorax sp. MR-S7]|uniref:HNH endonuclease n=1 Tax=Acidovorax sp. MR-S7 TaxID=1268622 RepID=UPI000557BF5B|nr:HNH endonuclease [Acidovorax sp. MR-S7]
MATANLTAARLRHLLDFDACTGVFRWRIKWYRMNPGDIAGTPDGRGYQSIMISRKGYRSHRLAWLHVYGEWPDGDIDHINGDRSDNRITNLRVCTNAENGQNRGLNKNNKSGYVGVSFNAQSGKWQAHIHADGRRHRLGEFSVKEDAASAYARAKENLHPYQPVLRIAHSEFHS